MLDLGCQPVEDGDGSRGGDVDQVEWVAGEDGVGSGEDFPALATACRGAC